MPRFVNLKWAALAAFSAACGTGINVGAPDQTAAADTQSPIPPASGSDGQDPGAGVPDAGRSDSEQPPSSPDPSAASSMREQDADTGPLPQPGEGPSSTARDSGSEEIAPPVDPAGSVSASGAPSMLASPQMSTPPPEPTPTCSADPVFVIHRNCKVTESAGDLLNIDLSEDLTHYTSTEVTASPAAHLPIPAWATVYLDVTASKRIEVQLDWTNAPPGLDQMRISIARASDGCVIMDVVVVLEIGMLGNYCEALE
jgi:hypothetical protein